MGDICSGVTYLEIEAPDIDLSRTYERHDAFPSLPGSQSQSPLNMQCLRSAFLFESASGVSLLPFSLAFLPFWHLARALSKWVLKGGFPAIKCVCVWCGVVWWEIICSHLGRLFELCVRHALYAFQAT